MWLEFGQSVVDFLLQSSLFVFKLLDLVVDFVSDSHHHIAVGTDETVSDFVVLLFVFDFKRIYAVWVLQN